MATNAEVEDMIGSIYEALVAVEAAHPDSPTVQALHGRLYAARQMAEAHFGLEPALVAARGGGDKTEPEVQPQS